MTFDEVFKIWLDIEVGRKEGRNILPVAREKGFTSIAEWRLATALRLGMDKKEWQKVTIENPGEELPNIIVGPYTGWQRLLDHSLETTFGQAVEIPEFLEWCKTHDRIVPLAEKFPQETPVILYRRPDGKFIQVEGGHRICAVAYAKKIGKPIRFNPNSITALVAEADQQDLENMRVFLNQGTGKQ